MTRTLCNDSAVYRSCDTDGGNWQFNTALPLVWVLVTCSGCINNIINYNIKNEKLLNSNNNRSKNKAPLGYRRFQIGCEFVEYDLFYTTNLIQNRTYIRFDRCLICIVQLLRFSDFSLYPLSFFLYSPFKRPWST